MTQDAAFAGSIPALYEECLVPVLFAPYAADLVTRAVALKPERVLEIAAGTGVVSHALAAALPETDIVATDLNPAMLAEAARRGSWTNLAFEPADAQALPFADGSSNCRYSSLAGCIARHSHHGYKQGDAQCTPALADTQPSLTFHTAVGSSPCAKRRKVTATV